MTWFALSAAALGHTLQIRNGTYDPTAIGWLTAAIVLCAAGAVSLRFERPRPGASPGAISILLAAAIGWQLEAALMTPPGVYLDARAHLWPFRIGIVLEAALVALALAGSRAAARRWFGAVLALHALLGVWMLNASPNPWIDVVTVHRAALDALLHHRDPYRIAIDNIYGTLAPRSSATRSRSAIRTRRSASCSPSRATCSPATTGTPSSRR